MLCVTIEMRNFSAIRNKQIPNWGYNECELATRMLMAPPAEPSSPEEVWVTDIAAEPSQSDPVRRQLPGPSVADHDRCCWS